MDKMKRYRYFIVNKYLRDTLYDRAIIGTGFALIPLLIDNQWIFMRKYYTLTKITSAINFGGHTTVQYGVTQRSLSMFKFKKSLKDEGAIVNLVEEKRKYVAMVSSFPDFFSGD